MKRGKPPCIGFYAPMKPPHHPVPSGDREMARNLIELLQPRATVHLTSTFSSRDKWGNDQVQSRLLCNAQDEVRRLNASLPALDLWVTYHNYYKVPDLIGPHLAQQRGIPYVQIESTRANKRLNGPWDRFARAAHAAANAADVIFYLTENDHETLQQDKPDHQTLVHLPPFLPINHLPEASDLKGSMLSVGMMRSGDKLASYQLIAETLKHVPIDWTLSIAGDGPARSEVEKLMAPFGTRVTFLGQCNAQDLASAYQNASLFLWPGVNEAFGMVYLEAQSHGLPVVAQDRPGLRDIMAPHNKSALTSISAGGLALAQEITSLSAETERNLRSQDSRDYISKNHIAPMAADLLWGALSPLLEHTS